MNPSASDAELVAVVMGVIAVLRKNWPKIDGLKLVLPLAVLIAVLVCYVADASGGLRVVILRAARIAVGALGAVSLGSYFAGKLGEAVGGGTDGRATIPPVLAETKPS